MATHIRPEDFSKSLQNVIRMYGNDVTSVTFAILEDTAEDARKMLRSTDWGFKARTGKYQRSFRVDFQKSRLGARTTVYAADPHYRLTHLLEKPHKTRAGQGKKTKPGAKKETKAYPHWKTVEEYAVKELEERLLTGLLDVGAR